MISNNTPQKDVDDAIAYMNQTNLSSAPNASLQAQQNHQSLAQNLSSTSSANPMIELQLKNYIQTQLNNGYNLELIRTTLINRGYNPGIVNKISNDISNVNINIKHEVTVSKGTIIGTVVSIFIVGILVFGILNFDSIFKPKESLLDISVSTTEYSHIPGENVNYQIHISNMGSLRGFDTTIKCLVVDDTGSIITRKEETLALETTASVNRNIRLPMNIKPGIYYIQIIADYGNKQAKSSAEIEVVQSIIDKKPSTYIPPTINKDNATIHTPAIPSIPSNPDNVVIKKNTTNNGAPATTITEKSFGEVLTEVKQTASSNPESAIIICSKVLSVEQRDICYSVVADTSKYKNYCDMISGADYRDNCYLSFLMNGGDVDVCDKMTGNSNKDFCEQLKIIQLMDKYYREGNSEKILELSKQLNPDIYGSNPEIQTYEYVYSEPITILDIMSGTETSDEVTDDIIEIAEVPEEVIIDENSTPEENITIL
ncbi:MAG: hypothetical protein ACP5OA_00865 [Candidatus Woesearchaeota archaeon]